MERIPIENATGIIANFTGPEDLGFGEIVDAMNYLQKLTNYRADLIPGQIIDPDAEDGSVELILILTGIASTPLETGFEKPKEYQKEIRSENAPKTASVRKVEPQTAQSSENVVTPPEDGIAATEFSYQTTRRISSAKIGVQTENDLTPEGDATFSSLLSPLNLGNDIKAAEADPFADSLIDTRRDLDVPTFIRRKL